MSDFSFCIIVKNEEKNLTECLAPLKKTGMEIIVLDTGSTDNTVSIAEEYTPNVYHFEWTNNFSEARNYAMQKASNDHILFLDADEFIETIDLSAIGKLMRKYPDAIGQITRRNACFASDGKSPKIMIDLVERFFDRRLYHYTGTIHEQVTHRQNKPLYAYQIPLTVFHNGYFGTEEERRQKAERNNALLFEELKQSPDDPYLYYQLGQSFGLCGDTEQEYAYYHKGCELPLDTSLDYVQMMIVSYGYAMLDTDRKQQALQLAKYYSELSFYADFVCMLGCIYLENKEILKAIRLFRHALTLTTYHVEGATDATPWHNLGCIYEALGNEEDALACYGNALKYDSPNTKDRYDDLARRHAAGATQENSEKYITLLIPCRDAADSLEGLFSSLEEQTAGLTHMQLIFLDLASKDHTWEKLNVFEQKFPDSVMLFSFSEEEIAPLTADCSKDYAEALIAGGIAEELLFSYAEAPLAGFIRPQDRMNMDFLRQYHQLFRSNAADLILCNVSSVLENEEEFAVHITPDTAYSLLQINNDQARSSLVNTALFNDPLSGKLFSKNYLERSQLLSPIDPLQKDKAALLLKAKICLSVHSICYINDTIYHSP